MSNSATKTDHHLPFRAKTFLAATIIILFSGFSSRAQPYSRLVILANAEPGVLLQGEIATLKTDFSTFFGISDIHQLRVKSVPVSNDDPENTFDSIEAGLRRVAVLCTEIPENSVVVAFIFQPDGGPTVEQIEHALDVNYTSVAILANSYFRMNLSTLTCSRFTILDYSRGTVRSPDSIETKDDHFPIIPVVIGGAAVTTGVILLTGEKKTDCTPVDPGWNVPAGLCIDGAPVTLVPSGTPGGTWSGTGVSTTGIFTPSTGGQTITYTVGEGSCQQSRTQTIVVADPDAGWTVPGQPCAGETIVLLPASSGGTWSGSGVIQNPNGTANFTQSEAGTYSVTYTAVEGSCQESLTQDVEVLANPDASWSPPSEPLCAGEETTLIPSGTAGGSWTGDGITDLGNGTASFVQNTPGTYMVTYMAITGTCQASLTQDIEVLANPDASWSAPSEPLCVGEETTLIPSGTAGGSWTGDGITDLGNGTASFVQNTPGTYMVTYNVAIGNCTASLTQDIAVIDLADPSWTSPGETCSGDVITLTPTGTPGGTWSGQGVSDNGDGTATFTADEGGTYAVTYIAGLGSCAASLTQDIQVTQSPDASWSPPSGSLCAGEETTLTPSGTVGGTWTGPGITDLGNGTATFIQNTAGTYAVTYTATSGICATSFTQDISVVDLADPAWSTPNDVCSGDILTLTPTGTPGGTWTGQGITDHGDGTATFSADEAGAYSITYTAGTGACEASLTLEIPVIQNPDASWSPPSTALCSGDVFDLTPTGTSGGVWSGQGVTDLGNGTGTFSQTEAGEYEITYTIVTGPCSASSTQIIMVILQPDASWSPPANVCSGEQVTLVPSGTQGGTWSGNAVTDLGNGTALFLPTEGGSYDITYLVGQGVCEASLTQSIEVLSQPDATWSPPSGVCTGQVVTLTPDGTMGGMWSGSGITDLGNGTATFTQNEIGVYDVTYAVSNGACTDSLTQQIEVVSLPDPGWTPPADVCTEEEITLIPDGTQGGTWSGPGVTDLGNGTATFIQSDAGFYTVTYTVGQGACTQESSQDIEVVSPGDPAWTPPGDIICPGAVVDLVATEGTWSGDGVTDLGGGLGQFQSTDPGFYTITLTVGSGDCTASESHDVEVGDVDPPVIDIPASDMVVDCDGSGNLTELQNWLDTYGGAEASDACSGIVWDDDFTDFVFDCGNAGMATVTFTATDESGNTASTVGVFTIQDFEAPVLEGVPPDIVVPCDAIPPPDPVFATDICSGNATVDFQELPPGTDCPYEIVRIWTATDACGNTSSAQQTIMATDDVPPEPLFIPNDTVVLCPGPPEICIYPPDDVVFIDNCDPDPVIMFTEEQMPFPPNGLIIIRCWNATDGCGNISETFCQNITILGEEPTGTQLQIPDGILITLARPMEPELGRDLREVFTPGNALWHDPGLVLSIPQTIVRESVHGRMPLVGIDLEFHLEPGISLVTGGGYSRAEIYHRYENVGTYSTFSGLITQQLYHAGLRFVPKSVENIYFFTSLQYTQYRISDLQIKQNNHITSSDSELHTFQISQIVGAGARFKLGDLGTLEIAANYGSHDNSAINSILKLNITSLVRSIGKH